MLKMAVGQTEELDGELAAESILDQCSRANKKWKPTSLSGHGDFPIRSEMNSVKIRAKLNDI